MLTNKFKHMDIHNIGHGILPNGEVRYLEVNSNPNKNGEISAITPKLS